MEKDLNVYQRLSLAREKIKNTKLKKAGKNSFSKYEYFTPEQIDALVFDACNSNGLITLFDLSRNEYGLEGVLTVANVENPDDFLEFRQATDIPAIKATNIAQQMGGMVTYTERYLSMSAFNIKDNSLDFDTTENTKSSGSKPKPKVEKKSLQKEQVESIIEWCKKNGKDLSFIEDNYDMSKEVKELIEKGLKNG